MDIVCSNDQYKVELASFLTDFDRKVISELYQPIIGYAALSLFFTLWSKHERKLALEFVNHSTLYDSMHISQKEFSNAKRKLEGLGLLRTFMEKSNDGSKKYIYVLYSPKSPKDFFDDVLFSGMLTKEIGEEQAHIIADSFVSKQKKDEKFTEVTASFMEEFKPNLNDKCYTNNLCSLDSFGRKVRTIDTEFNFDAFFEQLSNDYKLTKSMFNKKELVEIERLSTLYGIDELTISSFVNDCFDKTLERGKRLDIKLLEETCCNEAKYFIKNDQVTDNNSNIEGLDVEIDLMNSLSTSDYLTYIQKGAKPSSADLKIANDISKEYGLKPNVINCIFYYTFEKCDNKLPKAYVEKLAASLVRSNIDNAMDAYQYLNNSKKSNAISNSKSSFTKESKKSINEDNNQILSNDEVDESIKLRLNPSLWR